MQYCWIEFGNIHFLTYWQTIGKTLLEPLNCFCCPWIWQCRRKCLHYVAQTGLSQLHAHYWFAIQLSNTTICVVIVSGLQCSCVWFTTSMHLQISQLCNLPNQNFLYHIASPQLVLMSLLLNIGHLTSAIPSLPPPNNRYDIPERQEMGFSSVSPKVSPMLQPLSCSK